MRLRAAVRLTVVLVLLAGAAWLLCPRPSLYGAATFSAAVLDSEGGLLRLTLAGDERYRLFTPLHRIAPAAVEATLLYEDAHFYRHPGVNPVTMVLAAWETYVAGGRKMGASTLSMQLARLRFDIDSASPGGKLLQILRALQLERHYSKNELLEAYLNLAPYGGNVEGLGTAAMVYFDRPAAKLTVLQALTLAVIPQNPNERQPGARTPGGASEPASLVKARGRALEAWLAEHPEDAGLRSRAASVLPARALAELPFGAPHFVDRVLVGEAHDLLETTLSPRLQRLAERTVTEYLADRGPAGIGNAAVLVVDTRDNAVRALVGSADWFDADIQGQVNGTAARRSPGSVLKPFIYALALDQGLIHPMTLLEDAPVRYGAYTPENFDRGFLGPVFARDALIFSRNVPAVSLAARLEGPDFYGFLREAGIGAMRPREFYGLAIALGGIEVTMEEVVELYAALANGGVQRPLAFLQARAGALPERRLFSPEAAFVTARMLERNPRPDRLPTQQDDDVALPWKTGTSYGYRDAWTVGLAGPYVLAVWTGNFDGSPNPTLVGRTAAAPLMFRLADAMRADGVPAAPAGTAGAPAGTAGAPADTAGLNLRRVEVCADTGDLPNRYCPRTTEAWFIPGVSPIRVSNVNRPVRIDPATGERVCPGYAGPTETRVYEFWPSNLLRLFRRAGLPRNTPPPFTENCPLTDTATTGERPAILSPQPTVTYALVSAPTTDQQVPLQATADADARALFWFADGRFLGRAAPGEVLFWRPRSGVFDVRVVDDLGRADSVRVRARLIAAPGG